MTSIYQKFAVTAAAALSFAMIEVNATPAQAAIFTEVGDAGELLNTAQTVGTGFDKIAGELFNGLDVDLYKIFLNKGFFTASTEDSANFDTQLFLFDSSGKGVIMNDDVVGFNDQSTIKVSLSEGIYYLGISGWDTAPISSSGLIFPESFAGNPAHTELLGPTGPGGSEPLSGWVQDESNQNGGDYQITLSVTPVPEPASTLSIVMFGALSTGSVLKRKFQQKATVKTSANNTK